MHDLDGFKIRHIIIAYISFIIVVVIIIIIIIT